MKLAETKLPLVRLFVVVHIGTLNVADKVSRGASYEGNGLSVSLHPQAWEAIAKLGGKPWWTMGHRGSGGAFLDYHGLSTAQREALVDWGVGAGYLVHCDKWVVSYTDPETEDGRYFVMDAEETAEAEAADCRLWASGVEVKKAVLPTPTPAMRERLGFDPNLVDALDIVATFWVEDEGTLDGVWWFDELEESKLSAPRGCIVGKKLPDWEVTHQLRAGRSMSLAPRL